MSGAKSVSAAGQFGALLAKVARAVARLERDEVCCGELTFQQFETMRRIKDSERATLTSVAADLGIDASTASRNLGRLEASGYVAKRRDPEDSRAAIVQLTRKGERALDGMSCQERDAFAALFFRISPDRRTPIVSSLEALHEHLQQEAWRSTRPTPEVPTQRLRTIVRQAMGTPPR